MTKSDRLLHWLLSTISESKDKRYRHCLLKEDLSQRCEILEELRSIVQKAHEDARRHLRDLAGTSLDPLGSPANDPAEGYPECLHIRTLKGYFGEIFAGVIAENFSPFGEHNWRVPAFLFRFHSFAFDQLERWRQTGKKAGIIPGRSGDDCLAFQRDDKGRITRSLVCEAKCTSSHRVDMIYKAHEDVSELTSKPVDIPRLIEILREYDDPVSPRWVESLRQLWLHETSSDYERCDLVSYVCGRSPVRGNRKAWIPTDKPHEKYTGGRRLEAVETHLHDVEGLIREVYSKNGEGNGSTN